MSDARLDECRRRLGETADADLEVRAEVLEQVHRALVAELDDLLDGARHT